MLQFQFAASAAAASAQASAAAAASGGVGVRQEAPIVNDIFMNRHRRSGQFSERIIRHGCNNVRDTSLAAASRARVLSKKQKQHQFDSMDNLKAEFESELQFVRDMQQQIVSAQHMMTRQAMEYLAARRLQHAMRGYAARMQLLRLKMDRFLRARLYFLLMCKRRWRASRLLNRHFRVFICRCRFLTHFRRLCAARVLQKNYRLYRVRHCFRSHIAHRKVLRERVIHYLLFGERRALHALAKERRRAMRDELMRQFLYNRVQYIEQRRIKEYSGTPKLQTPASEEVASAAATAAEVAEALTDNEAAKILEKHTSTAYTHVSRGVLRMLLIPDRLEELLLIFGRKCKAKIRRKM